MLLLVKIQAISCLSYVFLLLLVVVVVVVLVVVVLVVFSSSSSLFEGRGGRGGFFFQCPTAAQPAVSAYMTTLACVLHIKYWNCFKGDVEETSQRQGGAHVGFFERIATILN